VAPPPYPSPKGRGVVTAINLNRIVIVGTYYSPPFGGGVRGRGYYVF